jgi:Mycotoxin biosynthesis protein UstYa
LTLEEWPRDDEHTLHCLDYIKEQLMCNSDVVLQGTTDLTHFNISNGHLCRDSDLITDWSKAHHWQGYRQYLMEAMAGHPDHP